MKKKLSIVYFLNEKTYKCFLSNNPDDDPWIELLVYDTDAPDYVCSKNLSFDEHSTCPEGYTIVEFIQQHFDKTRSLSMIFLLDSLLSNVGFADDLRAIKVYNKSDNNNPVISL
jgi:hypothetical protein